MILNVNILKTTFKTHTHNKLKLSTVSNCISDGTKRKWNSEIILQNIASMHYRHKVQAIILSKCNKKYKIRKG